MEAVESKATATLSAEDEIVKVIGELAITLQKLPVQFGVHAAIQNGLSQLKEQVQELLMRGKNTNPEVATTPVGEDKKRR